MNRLKNISIDMKTALSTICRPSGIDFDFYYCNLCCKNFIKKEKNSKKKLR